MKHELFFVKIENLSFFNRGRVNGKTWHHAGLDKYQTCSNIKIGI
jgi:hypothetical protein